MTAVAVFASGAGTTLRALLDHETKGSGAWRIELLVTDREGAGAVEHARTAGRRVEVIPVTGRSPDEVAAETLEALRSADVALLVLAGYLRLLPAPLVRAFPGRIINVHPALLPAFGGKGMYGGHVHRAVLESGVRVSGATVHLADEEYDRGTILAQWPVPVLPGDTPDALAARVQETERALYPLVLDQVSRAVARGVPVTPLALAGPHFTLPPGGVGSAFPGQLRDGMTPP